MHKIDQLARCFCGGKTRIMIGVTGLPMITCDKCRAVITFNGLDSVKDVTNQWNKSQDYKNGESELAHAFQRGYARGKEETQNRVTELIEHLSRQEEEEYE